MTFYIIMLILCYTYNLPTIIAILCWAEITLQIVVAIRNGIVKAKNEVNSKTKKSIINEIIRNEIIKAKNEINSKKTKERYK